MNGDEPIKPAPGATPPPPPPPTPPVEEAGTRALEDALQSSFFIVKIIMWGLVLVFLGSGFFTVKPDSRAIVVRLGKPVGEGRDALLGPGLHLAFPAPIDSVEIIPFTSLQSAEASVGWYQTPEERAKGTVAPMAMGTLNPATTSYVLTADTNIIHARATAHYTITDPVRFHFDFADAPMFITNALNEALLTTAGRFGVDDILTRRKTEYHDAVRARFQELIEEQQLGITVEQMEFDESPPLALKPMFDAVDQARQRRGDTKNKADTYAAETVARARGEAAARINTAEGARAALTQRMAAQASTFEKYLAQYEQNPEFFERFRAMEAWNTILTNAQEKLAQPAGVHQVRVQLSREPLAPTSP